MTDTLLQTKLFIPPLRPFLIPRARLLNKLSHNPHSKLTLISAPAGFGKTTLVVAWLSDLQLEETAFVNRQAEIINPNACWLSLDENDNGLSRFFTYVLAAIRTLVPQFGTSLLSILQSAQPQNETAVTQTLLNELAQLNQSLTLVLDDYHTITNTAVHTALATIIEYLPPHIHLIMTSREDPPLPLPRWRVRGQLTEIRADDLRFNNNEAAAFLQQTMGLQLDQSAIASLESRTEGWAAGLQMAALSLHGQTNPNQHIATFSGSNRHVADYLLSEVLYQQPPEIQQFLLQTAVLTRMCAPLCDYLQLKDQPIANSEFSIENPSSQSLLERLETTNLFLIPLDNQRCWYRYHHLFAELLRARLQRDKGETAVHQLHQHAAQWYESQNLPEEAIYHAFQAQDLDYAGQLVAATAVDSLWQTGGASLIQQWAKALPPAIIQTYPRSAILASAAHLIVGDISTADKYLQLAANQPQVDAEWHLLEAVLMRNRGQVSQALEFAQYALNSLAVDEHNLRSFAQLQLVSNFLQLAELEEAEQVIHTIRHNFDHIDIGSQLQVLRMHGVIATLRAEFHKAANIYDEGLNLSAAANQPMIGTLHNGLGFLHFQWHEMDKAAHYYDQAMHWSQRTGITDILFDAYFGQADLACWRGETQVALDIMNQFRQFAQRSNMSEIMEVSDMLYALFHLKAGQLETAVHWANNSGLSVDDKPAFRLHDQYKLFIATRISQSHDSGDKSQLANLGQLAERLLIMLRQLSYNFDAIELLTWMTLLHEQQGDREKALGCLQTAVTLAQPSHIIHPFIERGPILQTLLTQLHTTPFIHRLLQTIPYSRTSPSASPPSGLADSLTEREQEILRCLAAGLSNKAIEDKLFISKNTVRTHLKNVYSKLSVNSRTQAIVRARELELL